MPRCFFWLFIAVFACSFFPPLSATAAADENLVFGPRELVVASQQIHISRYRFDLNSRDQGELRISHASEDKKLSRGLVRLNEEVIQLRDWLASGSPNISKAVDLHRYNTIGVILYGENGAGIRLEVRRIGADAPPDLSFSAIPQTILLGQTTTLSWTSSNADGLSIAPDVGAVAPAGSMDVAPSATTTYTLTASGTGGSITRSVTVSVTGPPPTAGLMVEPAGITAGETAVLSWSSTHAQSVTIEPDIGAVPPNGTLSTAPATSTTYVLTAVGPGGSAQATATVTVHTAPLVSLWAAAASIPLGGSTTLSWSVTAAQAACIEPDLGPVPLQGALTVSPSATTTYVLTATGPVGTANAKVAVAVTGNPNPQPPGSFGQAYQDQVPPDATVEAYEPKRFALVTGLVRDMSGAALEDVSITILDQPGYGSASTGPDGRFTLPVEGGGALTVRFAKPGYVSAQRQVHVPWNDSAAVDAVRLVAEDALATVVSFDGNPSTVATHRASEVSDSFGVRAATVVLTGDNKAYLTDRDGNKTLELKTVVIRATEFPTPEAMPARLPPTSAFTWCAEFGVDGVERVKFEKPVTLWVENFLDFPVGGIVPVGYYDRDQAAWKPMQNGRVVSLLDTDTDGTVDALDADGDGQPDDLNQNGQFSDEVRGLSDSRTYPAGGTFWRAEVEHFSPIDLNWPLVVPADATAPNPPSLAHTSQQQPPERDSRKYTCSYVEEKGRVFHEDIPIPGTEFALHYSSSRVKDYHPAVFRIPVSGKTVPASLQQIIVQVAVAGRQLTMELPPEPEQIAEIAWDGLDHLGRFVDHPVKASIRIGFVYIGEYGRPDPAGRAFGQTSPGLVSTGIRSRQPMIQWQTQEQTIFRGKGMLAEGWSLSPHHWLSPSETAILHKGDGTIRQSNVAAIETVAGDGSPDRIFGGMGGPGVRAQIGSPYALAVDAEGNLYFSTDVLVPNSHWNHFILKLTPEGIVDLLYSTMGVTGLAGDKKGNLYISTGANHAVYKIGPDIYQRIAGVDGQPGYSGDGGPAASALLNNPQGLAVDEQGNLYITDLGNRLIRRVDPGGTIVTVAGSYQAAGFSGDGGPATAARFYNPMDVAVDRHGNLFIADTFNYRVRKVDSSGVITTVAGNGTGYFSGNRVPATATGFPSVYGVEVDPAGNLFILGAANAHRVWKVDAAGIATAVAGAEPPDGRTGAFSGDGGPATAARLRSPSGIAIDPAGNLFIADSDNGRVRKVAPSAGRINAQLVESEIVFIEEAHAHIFSDAGRHLRSIDLDTGVAIYDFDYGPSGDLSGITDRFGNRTVIERWTGGAPRAIVSPEGLRTELSLDADNHLTQITYSDGSSFRFEYSPGGLATLKVQPSGNQFLHLYDADGRLQESLDEEGGRWRFSSGMLKNGETVHETLSAEGDRSTQVDREFSDGAWESTLTDAAGGQTVVVESAEGLAATRTLACGISQTEVYGLDAQYKYKHLRKLSEQSPSGLKRETEFETLYTDQDSDGIPDVVDRKIKVNGRSAVLTHDIGMATKHMISAQGRTTVVEYDPDTLVTERVQVPGLFDARYIYGSGGRLAQAAVGSRATGFSYTSGGLLGAVTDPQGRTTSFAYDAFGRVTEVARPDGSLIDFAYDPNGNMTALVNPNRVSHGFGYNRVNHRSSYTTPLSGSYLYRYDKDRRPTETVFPSGRIVRNVYDQGRWVRTETPEGSVYIDYLCGRKIGSIAKDGERIDYAYDGNLLISEAMSGSLYQTITYAYDNDFDLVQSTYAGQATGYGYDGDGLLTQAGPFAISLDPGNGLPVSVSGAALQINRGFDGYGELESQTVVVSGGTVSSVNLGRDAVGLIVQKTELLPGGPAAYAYQYDAMGRLQKVLKDGSLVEEYAYDENGARIYEQNTLRGIVGRTYEYSNEDHLLKAGDWLYRYDPDGFLAEKASITDPANKTQYHYSSRGELLIVLLPDGRRIDYVCDPMGRRLVKKIDNVVVEKYLWQGMTRLLAVYDGANNLRQRFEYADARMPVAMQTGGATLYLACDQVGSLRLVADGSGNVIKKIDYDSFGNITEDTNPGFAVPFGFAGGLHDRDTGLVRFGYRDYDPEVGRWTAKDPIGFNGVDTDLYGYVVNNPVNLSDPSGQYADIALDIAFMLWDIKNLYSDPCNRGENLAALGLDVLGAIVPFATGLGAGYKASRGLKPVVIGENMRDRIIPYAKEIGADWYNPRSNNPEKWLINNERWLKAKIAEGREIIDIGVDPLRTTRSSYYEAEKQIIQSSGYHITHR